MIRLPAAILLFKFAGMKFEVELKVFTKTMRTTVEAESETEAWEIAHRAASERIQRVSVKRISKPDIMNIVEDIFGMTIK